MEARGRDPAKQPYPWIAVSPVRSRSIGRLPALEVPHEIIVVRDAFGHLQRQAARRVRSEVEQTHLIKMAAAQNREIFARRIGQRQVSGDLRVGGQCGGEGLADGADLEQRAVGNWFSSRP